MCSSTFQIDGTSVGWTLGCMLLASNLVAEDYPSQYMSVLLFVILLLLFILFFVIGISFALYAIKDKKRRFSHHRLTEYGTI